MDYVTYTAVNYTISSVHVRECKEILQKKHCTFFKSLFHE